MCTSSFYSSLINSGGCSSEYYGLHGWYTSPSSSSSCSLGTEFEFPAALDANWESVTCQLPYSFDFGVYGTSTMFLTVFHVSAGEGDGTGTVFVTGAVDGTGDVCDL